MTETDIEWAVFWCAAVVLQLVNCTAKNVCCGIRCDVNDCAMQLLLCYVYHVFRQFQSVLLTTKCTPPKKLQTTSPKIPINSSKHFFNKPWQFPPAYQFPLVMWWSKHKCWDKWNSGIICQQWSFCIRRSPICQSYGKNARKPSVAVRQMLIFFHEICYLNKLAYITISTLWYYIVEYWKLKVFKN